MPFKDPEVRKIRSREYCRRWREKQGEAFREMRKSYPSYSNPSRVLTTEAHVAHQAVYRAIKRGILIRPSECSQCGGSESRIEASHDDYSRPLDVTFLCVRCHRAKDAKSPLGGTVARTKPATRDPLVEPSP